MESFIDKLLVHLSEKYEDKLQNLCMVFPSRRAAVFFKESIRKHSQKPVFPPTILTLEDFIREESRLTLLDPVSLAFELFPHYHKRFPEEPFDKYYSWGTIMIQDFDEVDRYLVNPDDLYVSLFELKKLDTTIDSWMNEAGKPTEFQEKYLRFWDEMGGLYKEMRKSLREEKMASEGMALRELAEKYAASAPVFQYEKVIFAGFNALTPAEELLMGSLVDQGIAEWYWDMDTSFVDDEVQEAGYHFRKLRKNRPSGEWLWIDDHLQKEEKSIRLTAVPRRVGQAKVTGLILDEIGETSPIDEHTAIILPDESMLFPLLQSIPESIRDINVTMGFPMKSTPLYSLIESVIRLHENAERMNLRRKKTLFYFRDVRNILSHPLIQQIEAKKTRDILFHIKRDNRIYLSPEFFRDFLDDEHVCAFIFQPWDNVSGAIDWFMGLFQRLKVALNGPEGEEKAFQDLESEFLYHFVNLTRKMKEKLGAYNFNLELGTFRRLYREVIQGASIPFTGEPLKGLQVMGMLETRTLDFDRIIILSMNDGVLPPASFQTTYIPYNIRKHFGLPTREDADRVAAYHFYRLLKRSKDIHLIYNTETGSLGSGEKSRFISQIEAELARRNPKINLLNETRTFPMEKRVPIPITVEKSPEVMEKLLAYCQDEEKGLSPSALSNYLKCPLQFYYRYILKLKEDEEPEESPEAGSFGNIVHQSLEALYKPYEGQEMTVEALEEMKERAESTIRKEFKEATNTSNLDQGKNYLLLEVMIDMVHNLLEADKEELPYRLVAVEEPLRLPMQVGEKGTRVILTGILDRIDEKDGLRRVIDYKTGNFTPKSLIVKKVYEEPNIKERREGFQLSFYAYLYMQEHPETEEMKSGIYPLRNLIEGIQWLQPGELEGVDTFDLNTRNEFDESLSGVLAQLTDPDVPFIQTEDEANCKWCPYKGMCVRH